MDSASLVRFPAPLSFRKAEADQVEASIVVYEDSIPPFAELALVQLYGSIYSSLAHFRSVDDVKEVNTYVAKVDGVIKAVLLFRFHQSGVKVVNEAIAISEEEIGRFAEYIFARYRRVTSITFPSVISDVGGLLRPCQKFNLSEDIVLALPATVDEYRSGFGKSTRSFLNRYLNRLKREIPDFCFQIRTGEQIEESQIREIIRLNTERMAKKAKQSGNDERTVRRLMRLLKEAGTIGTITIGGRIAAGVINTQVGDHYFMDIIGHDSAYDDYRLGTLCCYMTVCDCIERGGREFHFMWGRYDYKFRLQGKQRDLDQITIYRSFFGVLRNPSLVLKNALRRRMRLASLWINDPAHQERRIVRTLFRLRGMMQSLAR